MKIPTIHDLSQTQDEPKILKIRWTSNDIEQLRRLWPMHGIRCAELLGRTEFSVQSKASSLGLHFRGQKPPRCVSKPWTQEEEERLRQLWPTVGRHCIEQFPGRSRTAIEQRASVLGLCSGGRRLKRERKTDKRPSLERYYRPHYGVGEWEGNVSNIPTRTVFELAEA